MNYSVDDLVEITEPQIFDPPKKMVVWDRKEDAFERFVCCIVKTTNKDIRVVTQSASIVGIYVYMHCAEIPEDPKPRRWATHRELSKWLAQGNGELLREGSSEATTSFEYSLDYKDSAVGDFNYVRKWKDTYWREPTVDYMGLE